MPNTTEFHMEQLRACAALGGRVEITEVGCDETRTLDAADMLANPTALGPSYRQMVKARARLIAAAALPGSSPDNIASRAEELVSISARLVARTLSQAEAAGGEVRYRGAA